MPEFHGTLCRQPSGRWAICRAGQEPIEITSGDQFKLEIEDLGGKKWVVTRMEFSGVAGQGGDYYSVDGHELAQGQAAAFLGGFFPRVGV